ncbi:EAL domain-containing protein [Actinomycetospora sp. TBRC 11914]|uniref:EAL domain-containing protein n=1 Tax=Actinomycetospora sp. TBRC 11914 TaxID=2729387 RepID=UPI00145D3698|nr:EAL domain-containing protein [Actinomycetospora sp. TBRC 11914]NMO93265.1 EAL domain-containing protein [Actinomycetospora sp. TBRC 11914]
MADALRVVDTEPDLSRLQTVFQPIVDLTSGAVVAHEGLTRGPAGAWRCPERLFRHARGQGRLAELDEHCRQLALATALEAGAAGPSALFLNIEPDGIPLGPPPPAAVTFLERGGRIVLEFTERALTGDPARLQWFATRLRHVGIAVALDDVGSHPDSLALMPFLRPEVVKLDQRLVQGPLDEDAARVAAAVGAYAERNDAVVLAEGIETAEHERTARALGATLGQGYRFGRPAALEPAAGTPPPAGPGAPRARAPEGPTRVSPLAAVARARPLRRGPVDEVRVAADVLEQRAQSAEGPTVLLATVGPDGAPCGERARRFAAVAEHSALVTLLGATTALPPGVRGATLGEADPLRGEWDVAVVGPHVAAALVARPCGTGEMEYTVVHERDLVLEVARSLMSRTVPAPGAEMPGT